MRKLLFILTLLCPLMLVAQLRFSGNYYDVPGVTGVDHVVIFDDLSDVNAALNYTGTKTPKWTDFQQVVVQQGTGAETLYPSDAIGYLLYEDDSLIASVYVLDYKLYKPNLEQATLTADMQCDKSILTLTADIPKMTYQTTNGATKTLPREASVTYTSLMWGEEDWVDSLAVATVDVQQGAAGMAFSQELTVAPPYRDTDFSVRLDEFVSNFGYIPDSIVSETYTAIAVCSHPQYVVTSRDYNGLGRENEDKRPISETESENLSAPAEINFLSNGNKPVALYYRWQILKGTDLIVERFDEDQRYTFNDPGAYQVKCWVYNDQCTTDSVVFNVSITTSLLMVPNVFTPNGDGMNDEFRVAYRSLAEFHCWVYNRWGKLVYKWDDPAKGWDGTINGRPAAEGAYYYIIRARGTDADPSARYHKNTKRNPADVGVYQISGSVSLIRGKSR